MHSAVMTAILALFFLLQGCGGGVAGNPGAAGDNNWGIITAGIQPGVDAPGAAAKGRNVDIFQNPDCDGLPATVDPEPFTDHGAVVAFLLTPSNKDVPAGDHIIEGYTIQYTTETPGAPPIQSFLSGYQTVVLKQDVENTFTVVMVNAAQKLKLAQDLASGKYSPQYFYLTYTAIYTFSGRDIYGNPWSAVVQTNFDAGDYNYCPSGGLLN